MLDLTSTINSSLRHSGQIPLCALNAERLAHIALEFDIKAFAEIIKSLRQEKGVVQNKLAEDLKLSNATISYWETCKQIPRQCHVPRAEDQRIGVLPMAEKQEQTDGKRASFGRNSSNFG